MIDAPWFRLLAALAVVASCAACSSLDNCPSAQDPITVSNDHAIIDPDGLTYQSSPTDGNLVRFPAKTELHFQHELGHRPYFVKAYLSFSEHGTNGSGPGSIAESAGNQALIDCWDSKQIVIRNDTCEPSFYILVTAAATPAGATDDTSCGD